MAEGKLVTGNAGELVAIILTLNEAEHIGDCLASLDWADRRIVFDSYSEDETISIASADGAEIIQSPFENYAQQRNAALAAVETDWVFFVDADERGTPVLGREIRQVMEHRSEAGWYVPRHNYIFGRLTRGAGWYPDYQLRLFQHGRVHYQRPVHEVAVVDGDVGRLSQPLLHFNYRNLDQFHATQRRYSHYEATVLLEKGIEPKLYTPLVQPIRHLWWRFVTLRGYQDGLHGLRLSLLMAYYEHVKYRVLGQLQRNSET